MKPLYLYEWHGSCKQNITCIVFLLGSFPNPVIYQCIYVLKKQTIKLPHNLKIHSFVQRTTDDAFSITHDSDSIADHVRHGNAQQFLALSGVPQTNVLRRTGSH